MLNKLMYLKRRNKVVLPEIEESVNKVPLSYISTVMKNLETYGYTLSDEVVTKLKECSTDSFMNWYEELKSNIVELVGKRGDMIPMYPNFPKQVMEANEAELYINAIVHYLSLGTLLPEYEIKERFPLIDNPSLTVLNLGSVEDFNSIFTNLISSKTSLSKEDKESIHWFVLNTDVQSLMPKEIPNKENLSLITNLLWENDELRHTLIPFYKTATDVLRLAVGLSDGDISLAEYPMFNSFKRSERRVLLSMLENAHNIEEDMLRHKLLWIRLGEKLHPGEYKKFIKVNKAFKKLRNGEKIYTFRSRLEQAYNEKDLNQVIELLSKRSGEFARNLDRTLRMTISEKEINTLLKGIKVVNAFNKVAKDVATPLLLQVREYFVKRSENNLDVRVFFPKGSIAKAYGIENNLEPLSPVVCVELVKVCEQALIENYSNLEPLGKVYIDEGLKKYIVPMAQRSSSKALRTVARGSRFTINENTKTLRSFVYWKEPKNERVDIDLSAVLYDENLNVLDQLSYYELRSNKYTACHSGDITSAPKGASEYIDIDLDDFKSKGVKYMALMVNSFTHTPYSDLPECFVGFMERECPNSGEIYEPKTVVNKSDITTNSIQVMPMIVDIENMEVVWTDLSISSRCYINNVDQNKNSIILAVKSMLNIVKPNMYDLAMLHTLARGEIVADKEEADVIFSVTEGITPYDVDVIMGEYI